MDFDVLRIHGSGAASDGGAQSSEAANLGNYRSSMEWGALGVFGSMERIAIERVGEGHEVGVGAIESDGAGNLRWTAPGSSIPGEYQAVADGATVLLPDGTESDNAIRVTRSGTAPAAGSRAVKLLEEYNNAIGLTNVANAVRAAGQNLYRCLFLKNVGADPLDLQIYLGLLGTQREVNTGGYAASGAVSVPVDASIQDWPESGCVQNERTGEVLYYSARTVSAPWSLTVPAAGRDIYAEVGGGAAGLAGDELRPISALRLAVENPSAPTNGFVQTIANETTAPTGVTWKHAPHESHADVITATLDEDEQIGLWLHRKVVAGAAARAQVRNVFNILALGN